MKIDCEIIKDLLPLYSDNVCSEKSKCLVEEHLMECNECKKELELMKENFYVSSKQENISEAKDVVDLSHKWKKGMLKSFLKGTIIAIVIVAIIIGILSLFIEVRIG